MVNTTAAPKKMTQDEFFSWVCDKAVEVIEKEGQHSAMIITMIDDAPSEIIGIQSVMDNPETKLDALAIMNEIFVSKKIEGYIIISEAWVAEIKPGESYKSVAASQHPDRVNVLQVMLDFPGRQRMRLYTIRNGRVIGLRADHDTNRQDGTKRSVGTLCNLWSENWRRLLP